MAYVPQFVPTNVEALQGTLNQYQQAYDTETTRQNQANDMYSALPTSPIDTIDKSQVMEGFNKVRADLDKKYNYDRANSQYAQELAREITKLRSNPLWAHVEQKGELAKMRQQLIATKGSDYHENFNPDAVALKDRGLLQDWKPVDLKDVRDTAALSAKEHAKSIYDTTIDRRSVPGYILRTEHIGYKDTTQAANFLNNPEGKAWLEQSIASRGFDPRDPRIFAQAYTAALSNLVGTEKTDPLIDYDYRDRVAASRSSKKEPTGIQWGKIGNAGDLKPYSVNKYSKVSDIGNQINDLNTKLSDPAVPESEKAILQQKYNELTLQNDRINDLYNDITSTNMGQTVINTGKKVIKGIVNDPSFDVDKAFKTYEKYFVDTGVIGRLFDGDEITQKVVDEQMATGKFRNRADLLNKVSEATQEFSKYYRGVDNYVNNGYQKIEKEINKNLKSGETFVADIYTAPMDIATGELKKIPTFVLDNLSYFEVIKEGSSKLMTEKDINKISDLFISPQGNEKSGTSVQIAINRESDPTLILKSPSGEKFKLKMNVAKMGRDTAEQLVEMTGLPQIMDILYKDINFANKTYTLDNKYLNNIISQRYRDLQPFNGLSITRDEGDSGISYTVILPKFKEVFGSEAVTFNNKFGMMRTLDEIYNDYIVNKK